MRAEAIKKYGVPFGFAQDDKKKVFRISSFRISSFEFPVSRLQGFGVAVLILM